MPWLLLLVVILGGALWLREMKQQTLVKESHAVVEGVRRILDVSTVEMHISDYQLRRDSRQLWGVLPVECEKSVAAFFRGKVSAGFSLRGAPADELVKVDGTAKRVVVTLPPPRLFEPNVRPPELLTMSGSICNKIELEDYARLHEDARDAVRRAALAAGILDKAKLNARQLLVEVARPLGYEVDVSFTGSETPTAPLEVKRE
jgi:hypothetical protein